MDNRERDAEIAERFFGLVPCDGWQSMNLGSADGPAMMKACKHANDQCYPRKTNFGDGSGCPKYSTDPSASKQLREKLAADHWTVQTLERNSANEFRFSITQPVHVKWIYGPPCNTEELAVAECALKLKESK
jgi:hypothetical protein